MIDVHYLLNCVGKATFIKYYYNFRTKAEIIVFMLLKKILRTSPNHQGQDMLK